MLRFLFGTRRRRVIAALVAVVAVPGVALAAWVVFQGVNGQSSGSFAESTTNAAITVTLAEPPTLDNTGEPVPVDLRIKNNATDPRRLMTLAGTFTTEPAACAEHMEFTSPLSSYGPLNPGQTVTEANGGSITVAPEAPIECAGGDWTIAFSGTTNP